MTERRGYRVAGRVQGVGFRWWTRRLGQQLKLRGDVWNRRDGSVEMQVIGDEGDLALFEERLQRGPPGSRVDAVESVPASGVVPESGFTIEGR